MCEPKQEYVEEPELQKLEAVTESVAFQEEVVEAESASEPLVKMTNALERIASGAERSDVIESLKNAEKCADFEEAKVVHGDLRMKIIRSSEGIAQVEMISDGESSIERNRTPVKESSKEVSPDAKNSEQRIRRKPHFADWVYETDIVDDEIPSASSSSTSVKQGVRKASLDDDWVPETEIEPEEAIVLEKVKSRKKSLIENLSKTKLKIRGKSLLEKHMSMKTSAKKSPVAGKVEPLKSSEAGIARSVSFLYSVFLKEVPSSLGDD